MIGYGLDRGGPKDSENAPNSFLTKINEKGFWLLVPDMAIRVFVLDGGGPKNSENTPSSFLSKNMEKVFLTNGSW